jgi:hypothetical protein
MPESGKLIEQIRDALLEAFSFDDLRQLLKIELETDISHVSNASGYRTVCFDVAEWAYKHSLIARLIQAAHKERPGSDKISALHDAHVGVSVRLPDAGTPDGVGSKAAASRSASLRREDPFDRWCQAYGFASDPFDHPDASHFSLDDWNYLGISAGGIDSFVRRTKSPCVVFGETGSGKTMFCRAAEADYRAECDKNKATPLVVRFKYEAIRAMLESVRASGRTLDQHDFVASAAIAAGRNADKYWASLNAQRARARSSPAQTRWKNLERNCKRILARPTAGELLSVEKIQEELRECAVEDGFTSCAILVDKVVEAFRSVPPGPASAIDLAGALVRDAWQWDQVKNWYKFVAFLPLHCKAELESRGDLAKLFTEEIKWKPAELLRLLDGRVLYYSDRRYDAFANLCDDQLGRELERILEQQTRKNPRWALVLARSLVTVHCEEDSEPRLTLDTWNRTLDTEWARQKNALSRAEAIMHRFCTPDAGAIVSDTPVTSEKIEEKVGAEVRATVGPLTPIAKLNLNLEAERVYLGATPVDVGEQDYQVLAYLYSQQGELCTNSAIIRAAWPDANQGEGVTDQALAQCISRLRKAFTKISPQVEYIGNKSKRGYVLWPDGKSVQE